MKRLAITLILLLGVLAMRAENIVSVSSVSGHPQDEVTLSVSLANTDAAVAFQTEIPLGSQLTYVANSVALNPDRITDHQVTAAVVNGNLRIYAYSLSLTPFIGNDGALVSFTLKLKNEPGDYLLDISQTKLSNASGNALPLTTSNGTVTILSPKLQINTTVMDFGHVPIRSEYIQNASVTNVGNEPLTITSIAFSNTVFSCSSFTGTTLQPGNSANFTFNFAPMVKGAINANATIISNSIAGNGVINLVADPFAVNEIHVGNVTGYCDSVVALPISMNNMEEIIGFQIEMNLDEALEFIDFTLSDRKTDHVSTGIVSGTTLRLMAYSTSGSAFTGDDGVIGTVRFRLKGQYGDYYLNPSKAVLANANGEDALSGKYQGYITVRSPRIDGNNSLDFGSSSVIETVTREYVVNNYGNAPMRIDQVVFDQSDFSVTETLPVVVGEWSSTTLHVSYNREQKGNFNALMKIYSNDPQNGLKNVTLSGHRYEPNSLALTADPFSLSGGDVAVSLFMDNYSSIVAMQANFNYPYHDYAVAASDFQLTDRFGSHSLYSLPINDSTFRILILSMQNGTVDGHDGAVLNITLHPIGTPSEEEYTVSVTDVVLSDVTSENLFTGSDASAIFVLTVTQTATLASGWNWWSTNIEQSNMDGLTMLENSLGHNGLTIKSQNAFTDNYYQAIGEDYWYGSLESLSNEQGYLINVSTGCDATMTGVPAKAVNHPITILPNWNWIGYPVATTQNVTAALAGFTPSADDVLKGQSAFTSYYEGYGWYPDDFVLEPGQSYLYCSNATGNKTLTYAEGSRGWTGREAITTQWKPEVHSHAGNIVVTATVTKDGMELEGDNMELGAFVNGECRGTAALRYFGPTGRWYAMLTVSGEEGETVTFSAIDRNTGKTEMNSTEYLTYRDNAVVGTLDKPFEVHFGSAESLQVYPNPVDCNAAFTLGVPEGEEIREVTITNALGVVVRREATTSREFRGLTTAGVYMVKVTCKSGNVYIGRILAK